MKMWDSLKLKAKLIAICLFLSSMIIIVGINSYIGLKKVNESTVQITKISIPNLLNFLKMDLTFRSLRIELRSLGLAKISQDQKQKAIEAIHKRIKEFDAAREDYLKVDFLPGEKEIFDVLDKEWKNFQELGGKILQYANSSDPADYDRMLEIFRVDCPEAAERVQVVMDQLRTFHLNVASSYINKAEDQAQQSNFMNILISFIGISAGLLVGFFVTSKTSNSISNLAKSLFTNSDQVATASEHIATSSSQISQAAINQSASLQETAASLEEISAMISKASESANQTFSSSEQSQKKANEGKKAVEDMVNSMGEINQSNMAIMNQINTSNQQLAEIVKVIQEIGNRTKVINEIVFQTKLLSFNASVEAARAGEHGKGFAVVAEEVGNLAQMSGNAAKEISDMLEGSIHKVESIVSETKTKVEQLVDTGKVKVDHGMEVANTCSVLLEEIVQQVSHVSNLAREISKATEEQSQGVGEINKAMRQLDSVTQQNTSASNEAAQEAEKLSNRSEELKSLIQELVFTVEGQSHASSPVTMRVSSPKVELVHSSKKTMKVPKKITEKSDKIIPFTGAKKTHSGESLMPGFDDPRFKDV